MKRLSLMISGLALLLFISACGDEGSQKAEQVRYVKSTEVLPVKGNNISVYNGTVKEQKEVTLSFKVGGPVQEVLVEVGDFVQKGQVIAKIDKRDYKLQVQATEAQYKQAKAEYERYQQLYERKKLPENTLDKLEAGYLMAKSQYESAVNSLEDTDLKAPFSGYINQKHIEAFETVGAGHPIAELLDVKNLEVAVSIPEAQINDMKELNKITCDIRNANAIGVPAKLKSLSKKTGKDRMYDARFVIEDDVHHIKPGMVAKLNVYQGNEDTNGILVPVESVFTSGAEKYVWLIEKGTMAVKKTKVSPLKIHGNGLIEVAAPIKVGDVVVTAGVHSLVDQQKVKVLPKKSETNIGGLL